MYTFTSNNTSNFWLLLSSGCYYYFRLVIGFKQNYKLTYYKKDICYKFYPKVQYLPFNVNIVVDKLLMRIYTLKISYNLTIDIKFICNNRFKHKVLKFRCQLLYIDSSTLNKHTVKKYWWVQTDVTSSCLTTIILNIHNMFVIY